MCPSLPGIVRVAYLQCSILPSYIVGKALSGATVSIDTSKLTDITLSGEAVCELDSEFDNNSSIEKCKLTFQTKDGLPTELHLAFYIVTVIGEKYVIGAYERPYPIVKVERSTGTPDGNASVRKYEVSFTARKALARCPT